MYYHVMKAFVVGAIGVLGRETLAELRPAGAAG
jgi:hypothetical protein